jgi:hypothetical protein
MVDRSQNVLKYRGASLKLSNGTVIFVVGQGTTFGLLPSTPTGTFILQSTCGICIIVEGICIIY